MKQLGREYCTSAPMSFQLSYDQADCCARASPFGGGAVREVINVGLPAQLLLAHTAFFPHSSLQSIRFTPPCSVGPHPIGL